MTKRILFLVPILLLAGLLVAFSIGLQRNPNVIPSTLIDRPLPPFDLPGVSDTVPGFSSEELAGKPRMLNIFASWCTACRVEHPLFMRLAEEGHEIHGLNWKDKPEDAARWLTQLGNPYVAAGSDESGRAGIDLGVTGVPETYITDRFGRVRYKHVGPVTPKDWEQKLKPLLETLEQEA